MIRVMVLRIEKKMSPFEGDRNHFHHLIFNYFNQNKFSVILYFLFLTTPIILSMMLFKLYAIKPIMVIIAAISLFLLTCKIMNLNKDSK